MIISKPTMSTGNLIDRRSILLFIIFLCIIFLGTDLFAADSNDFTEQFAVAEKTENLLLGIVTWMRNVMIIVAVLILIISIIASRIVEQFPWKIVGNVGIAIVIITAALQLAKTLVTYFS